MNNRKRNWRNGKTRIDMELLNFDHLKEVLEEYAQEVRNTYQDNLINNDRIAHGKLLNSVEYQVDFNGTRYEVKLTLEDYWKYIEYGTKPHFPPPDKLLDWVLVKPVLPRPDADGRIPTPKQLAYLIGAKIAKYGTKAGNELHDAIDLINEKYRGKFVYALQLDSENLLKVILGEMKGSIQETL